MDWNFLIKPNNHQVDELKICTDTRNLIEGCVYFALRGENFDGNEFAPQALKMGARTVIVDNKTVYKTLKQDKSVLVDNTLRALQDLACTWRKNLNIPIIAITGTNGKTTTKELLANVLSTKFKIHYTQGNLNNQIGVPITLLQLTRQHHYAIIEMGASHFGDIKELTDIAMPNYGMITNVGLAHLENFGNLQGVMQAKRELYDYLYANDGIIFRNLDNDLLQQMDKISHDLYPHSKTKTIGYHTDKMPKNTHLVGEYNAENISATTCIGSYLGIDEKTIQHAISNYSPTNMRSQEKYTGKNHLIIDAYNANPSSMQQAIICFKGDMLILGEMNELGDYSSIAHQNIVNMLLEKKYKDVFLIGTKWNNSSSPYPIFENIDKFKYYLSANPICNRYILIKGSRGNRLENIIETL